MSAYSGPEIVNDGLVLCLDAVNSKSYPGTGTSWTDLSGLGNNGTLTNGPTYNTNNLGSFSLDGTDDYISFAYPALLSLNTFSYGCWHKPTFNLAGFDTLFSRENARHYVGYTDSGQYQIFLRGDLYLTNGALESPVGNAGIVTANVWQFTHVNVDWPSSTFSIYHNGNLAWTLTNTLLGTSFVNNLSNDATIGSRYAGGTSNKFLGDFSYFVYYSKILSATEIQQNFNATRGRYFGYQTITYTASNNVTLTNNGTQEVSMFKNTNTGSWNGEVRSTEAFSAPCTIEFSKQSASGDNGVSYAMIGWNEDPTTDTSYTSIDHASYPFMSSNYHIYNNGAGVALGSTWDVNKRFYIVYGTDGFIRHYNGSTLLYSANYGTNKTVYVDSSFYSVNSTFGGFTNVKVARSSWNGTTYV